MKLKKYNLSVLILSFVVLTTTLLHNHDTVAQSTDVIKRRANFLNIFVKYIQGDTLKTICVSSNELILNTLKDISKTKIVPASGDLSQCSVVFIGLGGSKAFTRQADKLKIVTISDQNGFLNGGGMVELYESNEGQLRFSLNLKKARVIGIQFDSKIVELADKTI